jgi:hypothetical protein
MYRLGIVADVVAVDTKFVAVAVDINLYHLFLTMVTHRLEDTELVVASCAALAVLIETVFVGPVETTVQTDSYMVAVADLAADVAVAAVLYHTFVVVVVVEQPIVDAVVAVVAALAIVDFAALAVVVVVAVVSVSWKNPYRRNDPLFML